MSNTYYETFDKVLTKIYSNMDKKIIITEENKYQYDNFLILGQHRESITLSFKKMRGDLLVVLFDGKEPILLEECPECFLKTLYLNM